MVGGLIAHGKNQYIFDRLNLTYSLFVVLKVSIIIADAVQHF